MSGRKPLRSLSTNQFAVTYSALWDASNTAKADLVRRGYEGVKLTTIVSWKDEEVRHVGHLADIRHFLTNGVAQYKVSGEIEDPVPPCGKGINTTYINYVFDDHGADLTFGLSVWATVPGRKAFIVNALVCRDLEPMIGIENRLFLWMVCGSYPKAFALAMRTLEAEAKGRGYKGLSLTASQLSLVATYERQGFSVSPNACMKLPDAQVSAGRTRAQRAAAVNPEMEKYKALYSDRVRRFLKYDEDTEQTEEQNARFTEGLLKVGMEHPRPHFKGVLAQNPKLLTEAQLERRTKQKNRFWKAKMDSFAPEMEGVPWGDGIFMDKCFSV